MYNTVAQTHRYGAIVLLMLFCGLRRGEACAIPIPSIIAVYLRFKAFSTRANVPTLKGFECGYGSLIAHLEAFKKKPLG